MITLSDFVSDGSQTGLRQGEDGWGDIRFLMILVNQKAR